MEQLFVLHALGPSVLAYALVYFLVRPHDWTGPLVVGLVGLAATVLSQVLGFRAIRRETRPDWRQALVLSQVGGIACGIVVGVLIYLLMTGYL